jgi:DsbC/DsbD-like thiol-disulfide interchange protein
MLNRICRMIRIFFFCSLLLLSGGNIFSQNKTTDVVDIGVSSVPDSVKKDNFTILINLNIKEGWHINSNKPLDDYLTPTSVKLKDSTGIKLLNIEYPPEMISKLQFSDSELSLYEWNITIKVYVTVEGSFLKNKGKAELELQYQSCNNQTCLFPVQKTINVTLP